MEGRLSQKGPLLHSHHDARPDQFNNNPMGNATGMSRPHQVAGVLRRETFSFLFDSNFQVSTVSEHRYRVIRQLTEFHRIFYNNSVSKDQLRTKFSWPM